MNVTPKYLRARLAAIEGLIKLVPSDKDDKNNDRVVLRNGVFPKRINEAEQIKGLLAKQVFSNSPLSFQELTRFNSWFTLHPEKIAGKELISTSREFPITIKGTKEDILRVFGEDDQLKFQLALKMKRAKAKLKIMQL